MTATILPLRPRESTRVIAFAKAAERRGTRLEYRNGRVQEQRCTSCHQVIHNGRCGCPEAA